MQYGFHGGLYGPLSHQDIEKIHKASMQVLNTAGFKVENRKALELFHQSGAKVDFNNSIVRATEQWIMEHLKKAPARIALYGMDPKNTMAVEANKVFFGTGGTALNIYDWQTGQRRPSDTEDIGTIARLVDSLPNIHWYCLPVYPNDRAKEEADVVRFYHGLKNTGKHVMGGIYGSTNGAKNVIKLAQMAAGGKEELRKKPIISVICSTISPLKLETHYVDFIFDLVEAGIPIATSCAPIAGATSPITLAGTVVQVNAEAICGILMTQIIKEGAPVFYSTVPTTADMRTMDFLFGPVENGIMNAACAQMASYYNLPMYSTGGVTESKLFDVQNGAEKCMNNLLPAMAGAQLIHNAAGLIDSSMTVALEQYVLDDEIIGMVHRVLEGIRINTETLAVDEICAAGPGGNYLASEHTVRNMRSELYMPKAAVRANYAAWVRDGSLGAVAQARLIAEKLLDDNKTIYLPELVDAEIAEHFPELSTTRKN